MSDYIYLVRHGQTEWNNLGLAQGHTDIDLDAYGQTQAQALGHRFRDISLDWVVTSDLKRSHRTALCVRNCCDLDLDLRERGFGEWEGQPYSEVKQRLLEHPEPPGGESFQALWERVDRAYRRILERPGTGAVVTHGGTCGVLMAKFLLASPESAHGFRFGNTSVSILERTPTGPYRLLIYNDTSHVDGPVLGGDLSGVHRR